MVTGATRIRNPRVAYFGLWAPSVLVPQEHQSSNCGLAPVQLNGVRETASVASAIGLRGCLHLLLRAEMTALAFGFLLSL